VENIFGYLKPTSMLLTSKDPTTKWVPRCILLVFCRVYKKPNQCDILFGLHK